MKTLKVLSAAAVSVVMASCAVQKSETPLSPTVAGPIAGVQITPPKTLEPASGSQIPGDKQPLTLLRHLQGELGSRLVPRDEVERQPGRGFVLLAHKRQSERHQRVDQATLRHLEQVPGGTMTVHRQVRQRSRQPAGSAQLAVVTGLERPVAHLLDVIVPAQAIAAGRARQR